MRKLKRLGSSSATNTTLAQNWATHSAKGFRLDSGSNSALCPDERNNTIARNVAFHTNGIKVKNDFNAYLHNLALWPPDVVRRWHCERGSDRREVQALCGPPRGR